MTIIGGGRHSVQCFLVVPLFDTTLTSGYSGNADVGEL